MTISQKVKVSTRDFVGANSIPPTCDDLISGEKLCLPQLSGACSAVVGDTFAPIAEKLESRLKGYSTATLEILNPYVVLLFEE